MSNLGAYQTIVKIAKKFGGVENLISLIVVSSATAGAVLYRAGDKILKKHKKSKKENSSEAEKIYRITSYGESAEGVKFQIGEKIRVLAEIEDIVLIEKIGDKNNPYFVEQKILREICDYKKRG